MDEKKKQASGPVKWILIGISAIFLFVMLLLPLVVVVTQALSKGWQSYVQAVTDEYTLKALKLTIEATAAAVVCNTIFGLCAAWAMTRFHFRGKKLLTTLIDVPVTVSPVIAGLIYILESRVLFILFLKVQESRLYLQFRELSWQRFLSHFHLCPERSYRFWNP